MKEEVKEYFTRAEMRAKIFFAEGVTGWERDARYFLSLQLVVVGVRVGGQTAAPQRCSSSTGKRVLTIPMNSSLQNEPNVPGKKKRLPGPTVFSNRDA